PWPWRRTITEERTDDKVLSVRCGGIAISRPWGDSFSLECIFNCIIFYIFVGIKGAWHGFPGQAALARRSMDDTALHDELDLYGRLYGCWSSLHYREPTAGRQCC